ncbi:ribonuclease [Babesia gibsoni]|uniref:Ribosomal RNA-processing protein 44 n=1 Tax=Babesia gibsoni TaxID=33632 RepID=A0AAD8PE28_BABGI|nr:ribonuclease [Babesia gibsoni]
MSETRVLPPLQAPLKRTLRTFWRASGHSNVKMIAREVYHRNDIGCGVDHCHNCRLAISKGEILMLPVTLPSDRLDPHKPILILTVDVIMKQMTLCERCLTNCVIPATVANEVRRRSLTMYGRMRKLLKPEEEATAESQHSTEVGNARRYYLFSNENHTDTYVEDTGNMSGMQRDNLLIMKCAEWYKHHRPNQRVILLKNRVVETPQMENLGRESGTDGGMMTTPDYDSKSIPSISMSNSEQGTPPSDTESTSMKDVSPSVTELTVNEWAEEVKDVIKDVFEYIAHIRPDDSANKGDGLASGSKRVSDGVYPLHLSESEMQEGVEAGRYHSGILKMYPGSYKNGYVACGSEEYKVNGSDNLNRAIHGDCVCVEIIGNVETNEDRVLVSQKRKIDESELDSNQIPENMVGTNSEDAELLGDYVDEKPTKVLKKECRIVGIFKRNWREYCGSLMPMDECTDLYKSHNTVQRIFVPVDSRIPFIYLDTRKSQELDKKRIVVAIDNWDRFSNKPNGHWTEVLGDVGDLETESQVILKEHDVISRDFPISAYKELPPDDWVPSEEEVSRRMDFRGQLVFSVDPPNCKDIDDALGFRKLPNGHYEVSVHIADVTHFVKPNSSLDKEASQRCTTVYLVDRRTDMLPSLLTTNLCSLVANRDRLCFSVVWEFDEKDEICKTRFGKGIIKSARAFTYEEAQKLIDDNGSDEITSALQSMNALAKGLRARRFERGAVELESAEVKFEHNMADVRKMEKYVLYDTNRMVEELMLLANISVATKIFERFPKCCLLRRHPPPVEERMKALQRSIAQHDLDLEFGNSKDLNASLKRITENSDQLFGSALRIMTTRCMSQALYCNSGDHSTEEYRHYGLCAELYTHFTSPIRRYADVIVHRMLAAALDIEAMDTSFYQHLSAQCEILNLRNRNAHQCDRESTRLFSYLYLRDKEDTKTLATVVAANEKKICLLAHQFGIEATVSVDVAEFDPQTQSVTLSCGRVIRLFDRVNIKLNASHKYFRYNITAELL